MSPASRPSSWLDQVVGACFSLLVGAAALYVAVRLVQAVWIWTAVIASIAVIAVLVWSWVRHRSSRW